jgi:oligopeptide/dipeptide ABC transporter ATP-binding protein
LATATRLSTDVLQVESLTVDFATVDGRVRVLNGVNLRVREGEVVGIVGESGSGKSTLGLAIIGLHETPPAEIVEGSVRLDGKEILGPNSAALQDLRGRAVGMVFQESLTSLNPVYRTEAQIEESLSVMRRARALAESKGGDRDLMLGLLADLHIDKPEAVLRKYPHELSGGMRQRVSIAMSIVERPKLLILDEVTTGLDVYVQNRIIGLLKELNAKKGVSMLLITHDLSVAAQICDRLYVMYAGRLMEVGTARDVLENPLHPYTKALLSSMPQGFSDSPPLPEQRGEPAELRALPPGCKFEPRCPYAFDRCAKEEPPLTEVRPSRQVSCWLEIDRDA